MIISDRLIQNVYNYCFAKAAAAAAVTIYAVNTTTLQL